MPVEWHARTPYSATSLNLLDRSHRQHLTLVCISIDNINSNFDTGEDVQTHEREIAPGSDATLEFIVKVTGETQTKHPEDITSSDIAAAGSALARMDQRPGPTKPIDAVESGEAVFTAVDTIGTIVSPVSGFLDGLGVFCDIMDGITEVRVYCWN